ncbi:MAG TPA: DNA alkylation repair protein [Candidatus Paceibacterota bacterium]|jgi:3-methyladenine DNA glycosylase AlkD|nr:DNA alkylation repair protein [Candidatus Paceibacterota bacterium]HPT40245.1 DNA alkylation repair protein [Candidatus Paceibacterota bacterium]
MSELLELQKAIKKSSNKKKADVLQRFFKTGKGQYGEGDVFVGIVVPVQRIIAKTYQNLALLDIQKLLDSKIHEERLIALLILVFQFQEVDLKKRRIVFDFYLKNTKNINNWDLVDLTAPNIVGQYLLNKDRKILYKLARSKDLWKKRIAIISTFTFIKNNQFEDTLAIAGILLNDKHDLIQKAVGWMLREVGKRNLGIEEEFLQKYYQKMPRTMLRYAIEKFSEKKRKYYLMK